VCACDIFSVRACCLLQLLSKEYYSGFGLFIWKSGHFFAHVCVRVIIWVVYIDVGVCTLIYISISAHYNL